MLVVLALLPDLLFSLSSDERVLGLVVHALHTEGADPGRPHSGGNVLSALFFGLEPQVLLPVLLVQGVVVHFLVCLRVNIEDLIVIVLVSLPWLWHWSFKTLLCNEKKFFILLNVHSQNDCGVLMDFYKSEIKK